MATWMQKQIHEFGKTLAKVLKDIMEKFPKEGKTKTWAKAMSETIKSTKAFKTIAPAVQHMKAGMGMFVGLADSLGAMQPILDVLSAVVSVIGGAAMEAMMPALQELIDVLFSDEMMEIWTLLGTTIGNFLGFILTEIAKLLSNPTIQKLLHTLIDIFTNVVNVIMVILKPIFDILGQMSASALGALIYVVLVAMAFFKGLMEGTIYLAAAYAILAGVILSPLLFMQKGGITTGVTPAMLHPNEAVIPLDRAEEFGFGGGEEGAVTINITGGVFATDERELAKQIAKTIRLYRF